MSQAVTASKSEVLHHEAQITDLNHDGYGVTRVDGKVVFIAGALPGEQISFHLQGRRRKRFDYGVLDKILSPSVDRVSPRCIYFGVCGGCSLQHMSTSSQIQWKQNTLKENFQRIGSVMPDEWLPSLAAKEWGYRRKARLGARYVPKKGGILIGFREKQSNKINDVHECHVLDERAAKLLPGLHDVLNKISCNDQIPQIEISGGDNKIALIIRHLVPFTSEDERRLTEFARAMDIDMYRQPKGPDNLIPLWERDTLPLRYRIEKFDITINFRPASFTQVNSDINQNMIKQVITLLRPDADDNVLDLFCGLGNFTLPVARHVKNIIGVEGDDILVHGARDNAELNGISNAEFVNANLFKEKSVFDCLIPGFNKLILDPPRSGAREVIENIDRSDIKKIIYVSCNPATLARDAGVLVHEKNFRLSSAGVMDMFPHTNHVESMAVFDKE